MNSTHFVGDLCGSYGTYTFHPGFQFVKSSNGKCKVIRLGEFFFVRISTGHDPCIGELELLWHDQNTDQRLSSVRLYFLPEQTPEGRLASHGEDEVLMASDKVVLKLDDLVCWITDQVDWNHGLLAICTDDVQESPPLNPALTTLERLVSCNLKEEGQNGDITAEPPSLEQKESVSCPDATSTAKSDRESKVENGDSEEERSSKNNATPPPDICADVFNSTPDDRHEEKFSPDNEGFMDKNELRVTILSFPSYCRYRAVTKRLEGITDKWMKSALVTALGGFTNPGTNTHILFCRDSFEHEELSHHELNCEYLAPTLKSKKRKRKGRNPRCTSPGSESNTSEEGKEVILQNHAGNQNGFKQPPCKTEQEFLQKLFNFMKKRKTPIHRVPHLGFKQIDLFVFFSFAQKLGGYDKVTTKRLWKHVYDELGGDPGSTSAATCTRRHYEKLLLPFERFMDGKEYKPKQSRKQKMPMKKVAEDDDLETGMQDEKADVTMNGKSEADDAYTFTDSNQENSKDSIINDDPQSGEDAHFLNETYSDDDSKSIWSIQKNADMKEGEKDENKHIKPLIIQKEQNESFSEKERKWNEIRRKNALARKWVRQLRPSRGVKSLATEEQNSSIQTAGHPTSLKPENKDASENIQQPVFKTTFKPIHQQEPLDGKSSTDSNIVRQLQSKPDNVSDHMNLNLSFTEENGYILKARKESLSENVKFDMHPNKVEPLAANENVWPGYPRGGAYEMSPEKYPYGNAYSMNVMQNFANQDHKPFLMRETSTPRTSMHPSNMSDCSTFFKSETDTSNDETKPNLSQRRPSVIQHTEYITSPSPSQSPKQLGPEPFTDPVSHESMSFGSNSSSSTFKNQLSLNMAGKVSEWLAKGVPEAVACKTPSAVTSEKMGELHDKVVIPSVCKTPGPGSGKVPAYVSKTKNETYGFANMPKTGRSTSHGNYKETVPDSMKKSNLYSSLDSTKNSFAYQHAFHPVNSSMTPLMAGFRQDIKIGGVAGSQNKNRQYIEPFYHQPKRPKSSHAPLPSSIQPPPRPPSLLPFVAQQTYRKSPHSDIPKTTPSSHADYENSVLDLSVKKKQPERTIVKSLPSAANIETLNSDSICLDLSLKKRPITNSNQDNAIENITPPITPSPKPVHLYPPYSSSFSSKQPALIALQDMKKEDFRHKALFIGNSSGSCSKPNGASYGSTAQSSIPLSSLAMSSNSVMFPGNAQNKLSPNFISSLPDPAFKKELSKTMYLPPDPMLLPPYVIPPFYAASWTSTANTATSANLTNSTASPNSFKEAMSHGVFPKQYLYNYKNQFHPLLCKENGYYPPSCK